MEEIPTCLPPVRETRKPRLTVPPGSVDCDTHVFVDGYPMIPERGYTPPESTLENMLAMHATLGIERVVLTQPSVYGTAHERSGPTSTTSGGCRSGWTRFPPPTESATRRSKTCSDSSPKATRRSSSPPRTGSGWAPHPNPALLYGF